MDVPASRSFAARLRQFRHALGLTQEELAERAGMSARGIRALETGERTMPKRGTLARLADALELTREQRADFVAAASGTAPARLAAYDALGDAALREALYDDAVDAYEEAMALARRTGCIDAAARATAQLGHAFHPRETAQAGIERLYEVLEASQDASPAARAMFAIALGCLLVSDGRETEAQRTAE
jgi:transcriptional regulator with XRE-family HTH domain